MIATGGTLDRAGSWRTEPDLLARLQRDPATRVLLVRDRRVRLSGGALVLLSADDPALVGTQLVLLGRVDGTPLLAAIASSVPERTPVQGTPTVPEPPSASAAESAPVDGRAVPLPSSETAAGSASGDRRTGPSEPQHAAPTGTAPGAAAPEAPEGPDADEDWRDLRTAVPGLSALDAEIVVTAVALADWIRDHRFCPACGAATDLRDAGWSRRCPSCGRDHFPRTDPAVIVAVESADGERLLLGANAMWKGRTYSCFAGFVEAGESLETTVHRELLEESGVRVRDVRYRGSQPWPYPRSLMLGFRAAAIDENAARGDGEEILDARWFTRAEIGSALAGQGPVGLPGEASIARALIRDWYEG